MRHSATSYGLKTARADNANGQHEIEQCRNVRGVKQHGESWIEAILANKNHLLQKLLLTEHSATSCGLKIARAEMRVWTA